VLLAAVAAATSGSVQEHEQLDVTYQAMELVRFETSPKSSNAQQAHIDWAWQQAHDM
jgi:hypothetical protein